MRRVLPMGWAEVSLEEVARVQTGLAKNSEKTPARPVTLPYLRVANVQDGNLDLSEVKTIVVNEADVPRYSLADGDVLLTEGGDFDKLGRGCVWRSPISQCLHQNHVFAVRPDQAQVLPDYLAAYCGSAEGKRYFLSCSKQTTNLASINSSQLKSMPLPLPPITEQQRIVAVLDAADEAIATAASLSRARRRRFDAARQSLLENRQIARAGENEWRPTELAELTSELTGRNAERLGPDRVMGVLKAEGLVPMRAHVMAADLRRYKVVPPKAFAYNPMRLNIGSIAASEYPSNVLVSPDYVVFEARPSVADPNFLRFFVGTKKWRDHLVLAGSGSVRTRIYYDDLAEMVLRVPSLEEQRKIGATLKELEDDAGASRAMLAALRAQKRALMQKLLTGEWRLDERFDSTAHRPGIGEAAA